MKKILLIACFLCISSTQVFGISPGEAWNGYTKVDKALAYYMFKYAYRQGMIHIIEKNNLGKENIEGYRLTAEQDKRILKFIDSAYKKNKYRNIHIGPMLEIIFLGIIRNENDNTIFQTLDRIAEKYIDQTEKLDIQKRRSQAGDLMQ